MLLLVVVMSFSLMLFEYSMNPCFVASMQSLVLVSALSFLFISLKWIKGYHYTRLLIVENNNNVGDHCRGRPKGSLFNSYYTKVKGRVLLLSLDCFILPLIRTLYCCVLSKEVSSTIFKVFGMTQPGIELRSPGPLANTLPTRPMSQYIIIITWNNKIKSTHI